MMDYAPRKSIQPARNMMDEHSFLGPMHSQFQHLALLEHLEQKSSQTMLEA